MRYIQCLDIEYISALPSIDISMYAKKKKQQQMKECPGILSLPYHFWTAFAPVCEREQTQEILKNKIKSYFMAEMLSFFNETKN